jgi:hypothetical protein
MPITRGQSRMDFAYEGQLAISAQHAGQVVSSNIAETTNVGTTAIPYGRAVTKVAGQIGQIRNLQAGDTLVVGIVPAMGVHERYTQTNAAGNTDEVTGVLPRKPVAVLTNGIIWMMCEGNIARGATGLLVRLTLNTAGVNNFAGVGRITNATDGLAGSTYLTLGAQLTALDAGTPGSLIRVAADFSYNLLLF